MNPNIVVVSIVIPTYKRHALLMLAIESARRQVHASTAIEIIVVDDASSEGTCDLLRQTQPSVRCLTQVENQGPGPARDRGIQAASGRWVILLDDDDELMPDALTTILAALDEHDCRSYPVVQFASSQTRQFTGFKVFGIDDYVCERFRGDFVPVIQRDVYLSAKLQYPRIRIGGEGFLWWEVAERYGIPTWDRPIITVGDDAPERLTNFGHQVARAAEYAELQEMFITRFCEELNRRRPEMLRKKRLGAAIYWLLAGHSDRAQPHIQSLRQSGSPWMASGIGLLRVFPNEVLKRAFLAFRKSTVSRPSRAA